MLEISQAVEPVRYAKPYKRNFLGALRIDLRGLLGFTTVLNELLQNAEDAGATEFHADISDEALWIGNNSVFLDDHFEAIEEIGSGSKRSDREKIGSFGLGFVSVYQLTDTPTLVCRNQWRRFIPLEQLIDFQTPAPALKWQWATTFVLPWAFKQTALRDALEVPTVDRAKLDDYLRNAQASLEEAGLFLKNVKTIRLYRNSQPILEVSIKRGATTDGCTLLTVRVNGKERLYEHRVMDIGTTARAWVTRYGKERRTEVALIRPIGKGIKNFKGQVYAYLPTQSETGLPFHVNGDFYPTADRKDILWEGEYEESLSTWNKLLLETIASSLKPLLTDLKGEGADDLYRFCTAVQEAKPSGDALIPFTERCWEACVSAFEAGAFFHTDQNTWANTNIAFRFEKHVPEAVRIVVRGATGWQFMPVAYSKYAKTLAALGANTLSLPNYLTALNVIFNKTPVWVRGDALENTALLTPFFELLNHFKSDLNESILEPLTKLHWGVAQDGSVNPLTELERVTESEMPALHPWIIAGIQAHDGWLETLPTALAALIPELDLEATLEQIRETTAGEILEFHKAGWNCGDLYRFLALRQFTAVVADLPIFPSESYASFHTANEVVRSGDLTDPFNIRDMMDAELAEQHTDWLEAVGVAKLDHEEYFSSLLVEHFQKLEDDSSRREVAAFLVMHRGKIGSGSRIEKSWKSVAIAECVDGEWRVPKEVYLGNELMDSLFSKSYPRLVQGWEDDHRARPLFERFGVKREGKIGDIIDQLERLATEAVTSSTIRVREKVVKWLGGVSDETVFARLNKIAWLPDLGKKRWFTPASAYAKEYMEVMASALPAGSAFCWIDLPEALIKALNMPRPAPHLVVSHLQNIVKSKQSASPMIYAYLEFWAKDKDRTGALKQYVPILREMACLQISKKPWHPQQVFKRTHTLKPWRAVLPEAFLEKHPSLVKELGIRERPERQDHVDVLIEIAKDFEYLPSDKQKTAIATCYDCLDTLAKVYVKNLDDRGWIEPLKAWGIVPLGETLRLVSPNRIFVCDVSPQFIERYKLEPLKDYFAPSGENDFWRDLGAMSLKDSVTLEYKGSADSQALPGMTSTLQKLEAAVLRLAYAETKRDPDELTSIFEQLTVHQDKRIIVLRKVHGSLVRLPQEMEFPYAHNPKSHRLLVSQPSWEMCVFALAEALEIPQGNSLVILLAIISMTLDQAMALLEAGGMQRLPAKREPPKPLETIDIESTEKSEDESLPQPNPNFLAGTLEDQAEPAHQSARLLVERQSAQKQQPFQNARADSSPPAAQDQPTSAREDAPNSGWVSEDTSTEPSASGGSTTPSSFREQRAFSQRDTTSVAPQRSRPKPQQQFKTYVKLEPGEPNDNEDKEESLAHVTDRRGMKIVMEYETRHGRNPIDVSSDYGLGYDIESTDPDGGARFIELKTTNEPWGERGVMLSANQFQKALHKTLAERYWLYVVDDLQGQPRVHRIWNPAGMTQHFVFDKGWLAFAEQSDS